MNMCGYRCVGKIQISKGDIMYIYESHMEGYYTSDFQLDYDDLYCEQCGDSDTYIGEVNNKKEAKRLLGYGECEKEFIDKIFSPKEPSIRINRYKMKPDTTDAILMSAGFRDGGSWIKDDCKLFKSISLVGEIELNIGFISTEGWNDFDYVLVFDDDFGQPYTAFYGYNYGKEIGDFRFLQKVIRRYNEEMDKLDFLEKVE